MIFLTVFLLSVIALHIAVPQDVMGCKHGHSELEKYNISADAAESADCSVTDVACVVKSLLPVEKSFSACDKSDQRVAWKNFLF